MLSNQVELLLETGKTDQDLFSKELLRDGLLSYEEAPSSAEHSELNVLLESVQSLGLEKLQLNDSTFTFCVESLLKLSSSRWLNDEVILACMHLSDKHGFVRVGFSVPIHQQTRSTKTMARPFERASKQISQWHNELKKSTSLVSFFPIFQRQNHFSLLEINEKDSIIYHFDPLATDENTDVKVRVSPDIRIKC